ncbi:nephrocystin-3-like isoform X2 [Lytechinus variegatus]|uniref:nephrocystin-3-like isoform X2 n=1 Tax=Lytechinus variegatus TaxID=7654 RepID=UPI001BB15AA4|nr:nephrocystin-3-like isoform X2 [Lytechinus variegatus]
MGTGSSFPNDGDDDDQPGVIKRIPIEMKPRRTLGSALRSVGSFGRRPKGMSLRSSLSVELESTEVEKLRRDFEMFKIAKQNEMSDLLKKEKKLESENRRLRAELQALQKTCNKLRLERDMALDAEYQALERAATFEHDRNKVQRQFKLFRESKESEIRDLLRVRQDLEETLHWAKPVDGQPQDSNIQEPQGGNPGDWWTVLESEPSLGSMSQLQPLRDTNVFDMDGNSSSDGKGEISGIAASALNQMLSSLSSPALFNVIRVYICAPHDMSEEASLLQKDYGSKLRSLGDGEGRFVLLVHLTFDPESANTSLLDEDLLRLHSVRQREVEFCTIFVSFLGELVDRFTLEEVELGHLHDPGTKPAIFCFTNNRSVEPEENSSEGLKTQIKNSGNAKILEGLENTRERVDAVHQELEKIIKLELGIESAVTSEMSSEFQSELDESTEERCGGLQWDIHGDGEQQEILANIAKEATCELTFEKHYESISEHVAAAGPLPPLLVSGVPGSGKSLLLAKWVQLKQRDAPPGLVLYHFTGSPNSSSANAVTMIRRMTAQLMQHVSSPPALSCEPSRLVEEFPKWLEKVSSRVAGGITIIIDSLDNLQNRDSHLGWLLDPLPVDTRVIASANPENCLPAWKSWPTLHLEPLSPSHSKDLIHALGQSRGLQVSPEHEALSLAHCRTPATRTPLFITLMVDELAYSDRSVPISEKLAAGCLDHGDSVELYQYILESLETDHEDATCRGLVKKVCLLVYASRNGISELELFDLIPDLTWNHWAPLCHDLINRHVMTFKAGVVTFAHTQACDAVRLSHCTEPHGERELQAVISRLVHYFKKLLKPGSTTSRLTEELPYLIQVSGSSSKLQETVSNLCVFRIMYSRGRCSDLLTYWQTLGVDRQAMANIYFTTIKKFEENQNGQIPLPRIADLYEMLARFVKDLGLLNQAIWSVQRSLEIRESIDPDHLSVAQCFHLLGAIHGQGGKFGSAEAYYQQALMISENALGNSHLDVAKVLDSLVVIYRKQNKHNLADPLQKRAHMIRKQAQTQLSAHQVRALSALRRRTLQMEQLTQGAESADLARTLNELGMLYYLQKNYRSAESYFQRALDMRESVLGPHHVDVAQSLHSLATLHNDRDQTNQAEELYERALAIRSSNMPQDHPLVLATARSLAVLYRKQGQYNKAEPLYLQAVESKQRKLGGNHPSLATALVNLAVLRCQQGNHDEASPLYEGALKIYEEHFGPTHPRVAETLRNLAVLRYEQGDFQEAAVLYKRANEIKELEGFGSKPMSRRSSSAGSTILKMAAQLHASTR